MGKAIRDRIVKNPNLGYRVVGQVMEDSNPCIEEVPVLGSIEEISGIVKRENLDTLIMTFPLHAHHRVADILNKCIDLKVDFLFVPDLYEMMTSKVTFYEIGGIPLMGLKEFPLVGWNRFLKRGFDIFLSSIFLVIGSPIMILTSVLIKMTSRGPVFFRQERVGLDHKKFTMIKFRTMVVGSEQFDSEAGLGVKDDPRRTRLGAFLRRYSMDELPQLINVLRGEMSLVGPRPERTYFVEKFKNEASRYLERHRVRPGITGLAQVNGYRGSTSIEERIKHDLYYIENWSLGLDVKILMHTVLEVFYSKSVH